MRLAGNRLRVRKGLGAQVSQFFLARGQRGAFVDALFAFRRGVGALPLDREYAPLEIGMASSKPNARI